MATPSPHEPTLDERLTLGLTPALVIDHLKKRGWVEDPDAAAVQTPEDGTLALFVRPRAKGLPVDRTAVPLDRGRGEALARTLAASAARDGLDLAKLAASLGL